MNEIKTDPKVRILDVAEQLFAEHGADKATLRKICAVAGVNLAAVNYHFGSKAELINALVSRIMGHVVEAQLDLLDRVEADGEQPSLEDVIRTFLTPIFNISRKNPNTRDLFENLSKAYGDITGFRMRINSTLQRVHDRYVRILIRILPDMPRHRVLFRYALLWAATHDIVDQWLREDLEKIFSEDLSLSDTFMEEMVLFMAAGFRAA